MGAVSDLSHSLADRSATPEQPGGRGREPLVAVVMGSDSDLPVVGEALSVLDEFGVPYEVRVLSAHRTPREVSAWASSLAARGVRVVIAAAGGAAHLPGVVAAHTVLPVIGLPVRGCAFEGLDSLLSMVQMPAGVPVAVVAVDGARNAGLLAVQVLAVADASLASALAAYRERLARSVLEKDERLRAAGPCTQGAPAPGGARP